jgi:4-amino-4-deoxy-L-arabinose transferase-like glycosyltransferase
MNWRIFFRWAIIGSITGVTLYSCFSHLGVAPLTQWDEQTNIRIVLSSVANIREPILILDSHPFFEKPPLWYFINADIGSIVEISARSMRSLSAASGCLTIMFTAYLAFRWWGSIAGLTSWIILISTHQLFENNPAGFFSTHTFRTADVDSVYILFLVLAFATCTSLFSNRRYAIPAGILSGLAVLTKSPFGLVPLGITSVYMLLHKKYTWSLFAHTWGTMLIVALPWYLFMIFRFGESFLYSHFVYHIALRTIMPIEGHNNPVWYYLNIISRPDVFPGFIFLLLSTGWLLYRKKFQTDTKLGFSALMTVLCIGIPTIIQTKLAWYILPVYPFTALIIGAGAQSIYKQFGMKNC